ncbi:MAG: transcriptional regulator [Sorangiineae bacterium NIC37A_2]|jgi:hypothetical protein|nr:MAG: transcriptional regulator [Sorangiineae bacterium NIC37A_2]
MIRNERLTAEMDGDEFVVFLIGARINRIWKVHKWLPVARAMPRMLRELDAHPELGLISYEEYFGRTTLIVQYWRSLRQLLDYAKSKDSAHLPAWRDFHRAIGTNGDVGIWHETYVVRPGSYENIYVNMPEFGLGRAGRLIPAVKGRARSTESAEERLGAFGSPEA